MTGVSLSFHPPSSWSVLASEHFVLFRPPASLSPAYPCTLHLVPGTWHSLEPFLRFLLRRGGSPPCLVLEEVMGPDPAQLQDLAAVSDGEAIALRDSNLEFVDAFHDPFCDGELVFGADSLGFNSLLLYSCSRRYPFSKTAPSPYLRTNFFVSHRVLTEWRRSRRKNQRRYLTQNSQGSQRKDFLVQYTLRSLRALGRRISGGRA
jgi:hypothetical protein